MNFCVCKKKKERKKRKKKRKKRKKKKKTFLFLVRTKEATSLTFSICNFNRVDDTKDTKDFFLCAVCILLVLFSSFDCSLVHTAMYSCNPDTQRNTSRGSCQLWWWRFLCFPYAFLPADHVWRRETTSRPSPRQIPADGASALSGRRTRAPSASRFLGERPPAPALRRDSWARVGTRSGQ